MYSINNFIEEVRNYRQLSDKLVDDKDFSKRIEDEILKKKTSVQNVQFQKGYFNYQIFIDNKEVLNFPFNEATQGINMGDYLKYDVFLNKKLLQKNYIIDFFRDKTNKQKKYTIDGNIDFNSFMQYAESLLEIKHSLDFTNLACLCLKNYHLFINSFNSNDINEMIKGKNYYNQYISSLVGFKSKILNPEYIKILSSQNQIYIKATYSMYLKEQKKKANTITFSYLPFFLETDILDILAKTIPPHQSGNIIIKSTKYIINKKIPVKEQFVLP